MISPLEAAWHKHKLPHTDPMACVLVKRSLPNYCPCESPDHAQLNYYHICHITSCPTPWLQIPVLRLPSSRRSAATQTPRTPQALSLSPVRLTNEGPSVGGQPAPGGHVLRPAVAELVHHLRARVRGEDQVGRGQA